jgi:glycosyltransferase involved in cell wall biosynthesis
MDLCVIVAARNEERWLAVQLDALLRQDWSGDWEVLVVDNGSTDRTANIVEEYMTRSPRIRLLSAPDKGDKCYAVNKGVGATDAPLLAFTDADDVVGDGWLAAIARGLLQHQVVTGPNELDALNPSWLATSRGRGVESADVKFFGLFPTVRGNNFGARASSWHEVGGLVEGLHPCEDTEFSLRCWLSDVPVVGLPQAVVHYRYRTTTRDAWRQGWSYGSRRPLIARMLREAGRPRPARLGGWKSWLRMIVTVPGVFTNHGRTRWVWIAANRFGQVAGSIRYRTLMV